MHLYETLARWNLWGSWSLPKSYLRDITGKISKYTEIEEIIALIGPRRAGKSTVMYQIMNFLLEQGIDKNAILHINFEEPQLSPVLKPAILDEIYDMYRAKVFPKGKAYIFFDEIQNVAEWERWARSRNDIEDIKLFITGSSAALLSGELATVLTGRNLTFTIYPLSFSEFLSFRKIEKPVHSFSNRPPPEIQHALLDYLQWGGFPRVVLTNDNEEKEQLLKRYFDEILFKDVVQRHNIRNIFALKNIAIHLLTNTANLISYKRLGDIFQVSADLAQAYTHHLIEAFFIAQLPFYSLKAAERIRNPLKIHALDLGLRNIVSLSESRDNSKLLETQVHNALLRQQQNELFYWKNAGEIDLLALQGITVTHLFQVFYTGMTEPKILKREIAALEEAGAKFPTAKKHIITWEIPAEFDTSQLPNINIIPLWRFLLTEATLP